MVTEQLRKRHLASAIHGQRATGTVGAWREGLGADDHWDAVGYCISTTASLVA